MPLNLSIGSFVVYLMFAWTACAGPLFASPQVDQGQKKFDVADELDKWSNEVSNLKIRLDINNPKRIQAGEEFEVDLKLLSPDDNAKTHPKLLAGRFVFNIVPLNGYGDRNPVIKSIPFSGGGGIVYDGKSGLKYKVKAPKRAGRYSMFVCIDSTRQDIKWFAAMAKGIIKPNECWQGTLASPAKQIEVVETEADEKLETKTTDDRQTTIHRFTGLPKTYEVRVEDNSRKGWHKELRLRIDSISVPFGKAKYRRSPLTPLKLDEEVEYTYFYQRTEHFTHVEFSLLSIEKDGDVIYQATPGN